MLELERLKKLIDKLSKDEVISIKKSIFIFNRKIENENNSQKLFNLLNSGDELNVNEVHYNLYGKVNKVALKKLIQRLTDKILDNLISKELLFENKLFDTKSREVFNIKRKLLYYDVLVAHGMTDYALLVLNQTIKLAEIIEYYDYLIIALDKKLGKLSLRHGVNNFKKIYNEIVFFTDCNFALKRSNYFIRSYSSNFEFKQKIFTNGDLLETIKKVNDDYKRTKSKSIKINLFYLKGIYYFNRNEYLKCKNNFCLLYKYQKQNYEVVFNSYNINAIINIAECETMLWEFEESILHLNKIINSYKKNEFNFKLLKEMIFINYFYLGEMSKSIEYLNYIIRNDIGDNISKYLIAKRMFYLASINTILKKYTESNKNLIHARLLDVDKDGWNLGIRVLTIINNIELNKLIFVESLIENLRKHVSRIKEDTNYFNRLKIITKIFISLVNNNFEYAFVFKKNQFEFEKLKSINSIYSWELKSPEMLIFHEWFESKVNNVPYNHLEVMKRLKKLNKAKD